MTALLVAERAGYRAGQSWLVRDASIAFKAGTLTAIIGPNGAGKSTLLRLLSGDLAPTSGEVSSLGEPLAGIPPWQLAARRIVMAQANQLAFPFRVHEVVAMGSLAIGRRLDKAARQELVETSMAAADILHLAGRDFQTLSGGEQQRTQFARALCQLEAGGRIEPRQVLMLDEPVASLDLEHQFILLDKARTMTNRTGRPLAVVTVLHDLNLAACYADIVAVMHRGSIVAKGPPRDVLTQSMLADVFGICLPVGLHGERPTILPQARLAPDIAV